MYCNKQFGIKYSHLVLLKFCCRDGNFKMLIFNLFYCLIILPVKHMLINNILHDIITDSDFNLVKEKTNTFEKVLPCRFWNLCQLKITALNLISLAVFHQLSSHMLVLSTLFTKKLFFLLFPRIKFGGSSLSHWLHHYHLLN